MMPASIRGEKRRKIKPVPRETCALCGRTGKRGFITRGGLRVCWAVPRCMERTLAEPPPLTFYSYLRADKSRSGYTVFSTGINT
jgi:hypothetical protein